MKIRRLLPLLLVPLIACKPKPTPPKAPSYTRPPVTLVPGIGNASFPIQTANPQAQAFFNQGLQYLYAFNFDESRRSFARAATLDPTSPMPLWGVALALSPNYNDTSPDPNSRAQAWQALEQAQPLAAHADPRERDYLSALTQLYDPVPPHNLHGDRYAHAMAQLAARYPADLDAATLYAQALMDLNAWNLWSSTGRPRPTTPLILATLQSVLARDPSHVGANHLLIHAVEASRNPALALPAAQRLATLAPAAGHLLHMPSHIQLHLGLYAAAAQANRNAILADDAYYQSQHNPPPGTLAYDSYRVHNMYFLVAACNLQPDDACAQQAAAALAAYARSAHLNPWFLVSQPWMQVRFEHWTEILAAPPLPPETPKVLADMTLYARACALVATNRLPEAQAALARFTQLAQTLPADTPTDFGTPAAPIYTLARLDLQSRLDLAQHHRPAALAALRHAAALQSTFGYSEPPDFYLNFKDSLFCHSRREFASAAVSPATNPPTHKRVP